MPRDTARSREVRRLEALLDNYRGTCRECGRTGVLLDRAWTYDGFDETCLTDTEECRRLAPLHRTEMIRIQRENRAQTDSDMARQMRGFYNSAMLGASASILKSFARPGTTMEWRRYGKV